MEGSPHWLKRPPGPIRFSEDRTAFKLPLDVSLRYGLITQAVDLLGTLVCALTIDQIGRRLWFAVAFAAAAISLGLLATHATPTAEQVLLHMTIAYFFVSTHQYRGLSLHAGTLSNPCAGGWRGDRHCLSEVDRRTREELEAVLRTAIHRKILEDGSEGFTLLARNITDYRRDVLKEQFIASMEASGWVEREDSIRRFSRWMGFRRIGPNIEEAARSVINGLIRDHRILSKGSQIQRVRNESGDPNP